MTQGIESGGFSFRLSAQSCALFGLVLQRTLRKHGGPAQLGRRFDPRRGRHKSG